MVVVEVWQGTLGVDWMVAVEVRQRTLAVVVVEVWQGTLGADSWMVVVEVRQGTLGVDWMVVVEVRQGGEEEGGGGEGVS